MTDSQKRKELQTEALRLYDEGHFVIPCRSGEKRPLIKWNRNAKRLSRDALAKFWEKDGGPPDVAIRVDDKTLILDLDPRHHDAVKGLYDDLKQETRCSTTPSGGLHAYFRIETPLRPRTYRGMDVLTKGRMAIVPPSEGREWVGKDSVTKAGNPGALIDQMVERANIKQLVEGEGLARDALVSLDDIPVHRRNHTLTAIAGVLRSAGFRGNRLEAAIQGLVDHIVEQPKGNEITPEDVARICSSIDWRKPRPFETTEATKYEFNTSDKPPVLKWLVKDFLPAEGVTSLFGMGKQGKSYIAMELLRCLQLSTEFLELETLSEPIKVLYVDWEKRGASLQRRLHALASEDAIHVDVLEPHGALVTMTERLVAEVGIGGYGLVIIDSLTIALMQGDVTEAATVVPAMFALNALGCPVLVLDHTKKPAFGEAYEALSAFGSVFKGNIASMNWQLQKLSGDAIGLNVILRHVNNNYDVDPQDIHVHIGFEFDRFGGVSKATLERKEVTETDNEVFEHLALQLEPLTLEEIAVTLRISIPKARRTLMMLQDDGFVSATKDGDHWVAIQAPGEAD